MAFHDKKPAPRYNTTDYLNLPTLQMPENRAAEKGVIAAVAKKTDLLFTHDIDTDHFCDPKHKMMLAAIRDLATFHKHASTNVADLVAQGHIAGMMEKMGGEDYVAQVLAETHSVSHFEKGLQMIKDVALQRKAMQAGLFLAREASGKSQEQLATLVNDQMERLFRNAGPQKADHTVKSVVEEMLAAREDFKHGRGQCGIKLGVEPLDLALGSIQPCYFVVGAASSTGKTALLGSALLSMCQRGLKCIFFSQEMKRREIVARMVASLTGISARVITECRWSDSDHKLVMRKMREVEDVLDQHCEIIDDSGISTADIRAKTMAFQRRHGSLAAVFVDYIQVISVPGVNWGDARARVEQCSHALKNLGKDMNCLVFALSQLTPDAQNGQVRPHIDMLRDAKDIRNHADIVLLMSRKESRDVRQDGNDLLLAHFAKGRSIGEFETDMLFVPKFMRFESVANYGPSSFENGATPFDR